MEDVVEVTVDEHVPVILEPVLPEIVMRAHRARLDGAHVLKKVLLRRGR